MDPVAVAHPTDDAVLRVGGRRRAHRSERGRLHAALAAPARGGLLRGDPRGLRRDGAVGRRTPAPRGLDPATGTLGVGRGLAAAAVREHRGRAGPAGCARGWAIGRSTPELVDAWRSTVV